MVIDSSALIALLLDEPKTADFVAALAADTNRLLSASSYLEIAIVMMGRWGPNAVETLDRLLDELSIDVMPFSREQAVLAIAAYREFGKGRGHAAGLNFGDCFWYGLAKCTGDPLLFKGDDFSRTDLVPAVRNL